MKRRLFLLATFIICALLLTACVSVPNNESDMLSNTKSETENSYSDNNTVTNTTLTLTPMNTTEHSRYVPVSVTAEILTEEECEALTLDLYDEIVTIAREFYGYPQYLNIQPGEYPAGDIPYTEVYVESNPTLVLNVVFENDADSIRALLKEYFTDNLITQAFNLEYPCPIYEENGKLYRTVLEPQFGRVEHDISAGRVLSRENGVVRYGFPIHFVDISTGEYNEESDTPMLGYMDFLYEDGVWKIDDFRIGYGLYSWTDLPGRYEERYIDADYFDFGHTFEQDGIAVELEKGGNVNVVIDENTISASLESNAMKIKSIEKAGNNIFVSFLGVLGQIETIVINGDENTITNSFISDGFCTTDEGNWYYVTINRTEGICELFDKNDTALSSCIAMTRKNESAWREIPLIDSLELTDKGFEIMYDASQYDVSNQEETK